MTSSSIFLFGMMGALAPEILRLYELRNDPSRFRWSWFYVIISLALAALAGLVAIILPTTNFRDAFYAGIATPVIITTAAKKVGHQRRKKKLVKGTGTSAPTSQFELFFEAL